MKERGNCKKGLLCKESYQPQGNTKTKATSHPRSQVTTISNIPNVHECTSNCFCICMNVKRSKEVNPFKKAGLSKQIETFYLRRGNISLIHVGWKGKTNSGYTCTEESNKNPSCFIWNLALIQRLSLCIVYTLTLRREFLMEGEHRSIHTGIEPSCNVNFVI